MYDAIEEWCQRMWTTGEGERNETANAGAYRFGYLEASGLPVDEALRQFRKACEASGLPDAEIDNTLERAADDGRRDRALERR